LSALLLLCRCRVIRLRLKRIIAYNLHCQQYFLFKAKRMLTLEQVKEQLSTHNLRAVARKVDLPYMQVWRAMRKDAPVNYQVVKKLSDFLTKQG
jgi:molybdenum-dependent DNA-binding transcriptional regulator ModE